MLKRAYGPWMMTAFRVLAKLRFLRGTALDPFGRTEERQAERRLIVQYEALIEEIFERLSAETLAVSVSLASLPERIRGFGHIKERSMREAGVERTRLLERLRQPATRIAAE
jgi:indolepyruvate ferredoxin oxidoreductase